MLLLAEGAQAQTLERIRDTGTFKLGYREDAAPFSFRNTLGEPAGFSVELCRLVAAEARAALGLDEIAIEYVAVGTEDRFQAVQDRRIDILCGATTVTLSRRELVDFSLVTFVDGAAVLLRADGPEDLLGLAGQRIGVREATTTEQALRETLAEVGLDAEVVTVASHEDGLARLEAGDIAAYFGDQAILMFLRPAARLPRTSSCPRSSSPSSPMRWRWRAATATSGCWSIARSRGSTGRARSISCSPTPSAATPTRARCCARSI
jgi:polar amino acid transport system substrate-binding protein/glutamate/aspartate transport system substrate-binding protein